jgi:hypothetical protein
VQDALKQIPNVWEDSRFLAGEPGKLVVMARRGTDGRWWIAGFNGENSAKTVDIDLSELGNVNISGVIGDTESGGFERKPASMDGKVMKVTFKPYGGFLTVAK